MDFVMPLVLFLGAILTIAILGFVGLKFYNLTTKELAFVRTGAGSEKVVLNGGAFVIPGIHQMVKVAMKTLRLEVEKKDRESLITQDRLRVDVKADFFVRVKADAESVSRAAQTLGEITLNPAALKTQVEAKFVDALRSVAVRMTMYDLNAKRAEFVAEVRKVVADDIAQNGLELESVSLTALNQTKKEYFDPNNAFDAEGLLALTRETEMRRKSVNDIEQDTRVQIETKNLDATRQQQALHKQTEEVKLSTERDIANLTADQKAAIAEKEAETRRLAESAAIMANQQIANSRIAAEQVTRENQVTSDAAVRIREQEQAILVANKSELQAAADAKAALARAEAVKAEEKVTTARDVEIAERAKAVTLVRAQEEAQQAATAVTVQAEAEKNAAANRADAARLVAEGERDAAVARAAGTLAEGQAAAEALFKRNEALNSLSAAQIELQRALAIVTALPELVAASVKPLENIDSIRIADVRGLSAGFGGSSGGGSADSAGGSHSLSEQVVKGALTYRAQAPLVDGLMKEVGLAGGGDMSQLLAGVAGVGMAHAPAAVPTAPVADHDATQG